MKINIRNMKIIGILLIAFLIITTNVYAASDDSYETTLSVDKAQAKAGDIITLTVGLSNISIKSGEQGIGGYSSNITFDSSVLEYVSTNGTNIWDAPFYQNKTIVATTKNGGVIDTTQSIGTITFKVKDDAKLGKTTIGLANFSATIDPNLPEIPTANKSIDVTIVSDGGTGTGGNNSGNTGNTGNGSEQPGSGNNGGSISANGSNKGNGVSTTTKKENIKQGVLPKAGSNNVITFTAIGGCTLLAIGFYVKFRVIDRKMKNK